MLDTLFPKIQQRTIEDEIVQHLRAAIVGQRIELGARLNESELAKGLEVSRIPIREALRKLEQEGLVERFPNRGCFVITFTEQDVEEVFSLRSNLECMSIDWAVKHIIDDDIAHLRGLIVRQQHAIEEQNFADLARLDMQFHEFICIKAEHTRLLKAWHEQHAQSQMLLNIRFRAMPEYTPETVISDHTNILDALERRDAATANALTLDISRRVGDECIVALRRTLR